MDYTKKPGFDAINEAVVRATGLDLNEKRNSNRGPESKVFARDMNQKDDEDKDDEKDEGLAKDLHRDNEDRPSDKFDRASRTSVGAAKRPPAVSFNKIKALKDKTAGDKKEESESADDDFLESLFNESSEVVDRLLHASAQEDASNGLKTPSSNTHAVANVHASLPSDRDLRNNEDHALMHKHHSEVSAIHKKKGDNTRHLYHAALAGAHKALVGAKKEDRDLAEGGGSRARKAGNQFKAAVATAHDKSPGAIKQIAGDYAKAASSKRAGKDMTKGSNYIKHSDRKWQASKSASSEADPLHPRLPNLGKGPMKAHEKPVINQNAMKRGADLIRLKRSKSDPHDTSGDEAKATVAKAKALNAKIAAKAVGESAEKQQTRKDVSTVPIMPQRPKKPVVPEKKQESVMSRYDKITYSLEEWNSLCGISLLEGVSLPTASTDQSNAMKGGDNGLKGKPVQSAHPTATPKDEVGADEEDTLDDDIVQTEEISDEVMAAEFEEFLSERGLDLELFTQLVDEAVESGDDDELAPLLAFQELFEATMKKKGGAELAAKHGMATNHFVSRSEQMRKFRERNAAPAKKEPGLMGKLLKKLKGEEVESNEDVDIDLDNIGDGNLWNELLSKYGDKSVK